nr:TIR domain-containing protein [Acidobacteriota bacterium]
MTQNLPLQSLGAPHDESRRTVFISYARKNADFAQRLIGDLKGAAYTCWIDTSDIRAGDEAIRAIARSITGSDAFLVIVTRTALDSEWVRDEILWARKKKKLIIPLILEDVRDDDDYILLNRYQDVLFDGDYAAAISKLKESLASPAPPETKESRPRSPRREDELAYLEFLQFKKLAGDKYAPKVKKFDSDKYTPMGGDSQQKMQPLEMPQLFELLAMGEERLSQTRQEFENAVAEICRINRAVLLGEPGGGKTSTLRKLSVVLAEKAEQDHDAPIPLFIELGKWNDAEQPLETFIAAQLGELGDALSALLNDKRAALLLDGLNELPVGQRDDKDGRDGKYTQVQSFIERHPQLLAVVSCREQDYKGIDLGFDRINIKPLDPERIREFAKRYLGATAGESLFWSLAGGEEVRGVWEVWQRAGASFEQFLNEPDIPRENPDVHSKTSVPQDDVWREKVRGQHSLLKLASNPYMLLMLASVYAKQQDLPKNRGDLFRLFVEELLKRESKREEIVPDEKAELLEGLAKIAYRMQVHRADDPDGEASTALPKEEAGRLLRDRLLALAGSASILSLGDQVRFTHQLLQEYFAARAMDNEIRAGELNASGIWKPGNWWQRTNWEEAAILLAGFDSNDCSRIVEWVAEANPEVAAQCVVGSGVALADATGERLRAKWIPRLTDLKRDPKPQARAAIGRALALPGWDNRPGVGVVRDASGLALPDIDWVKIASGEFQYGDESGGAA